MAEPKNRQLAKSRMLGRKPSPNQVDQSPPVRPASSEINQSMTSQQTEALALSQREQLPTQAASPNPLSQQKPAQRQSIVLYVHGGDKPSLDKLDQAFYKLRNSNPLVIIGTKDAALTEVAPEWKAVEAVAQRNGFQMKRMQIPSQGGKRVPTPEVWKTANRMFTFGKDSVTKNVIKAGYEAVIPVMPFDQQGNMLMEPADPVKGTAPKQSKFMEGIIRMQQRTSKSVPKELGGGVYQAQMEQLRDLRSQNQFSSVDLSYDKNGNPVIRKRLPGVFFDKDTFRLAGEDPPDDMTLARYRNSAKGLVQLVKKSIINRLTDGFKTQRHYLLHLYEVGDRLQRTTVSSVRGNISIPGTNLSVSPKDLGVALKIEFLKEVEEKIKPKFATLEVNPLLDQILIYDAEAKRALANNPQARFAGVSFDRLFEKIAMDGSLEDKKRSAASRLHRYETILLNKQRGATNYYNEKLTIPFNRFVLEADPKTGKLVEVPFEAERHSPYVQIKARDDSTGLVFLDEKGKTIYTKTITRKEFETDEQYAGLRQAILEDAEQGGSASKFVSFKRSDVQELVGSNKVSPRKGKGGGTPAEVAEQVMPGVQQEAAASVGRPSEGPKVDYYFRFDPEQGKHIRVDRTNIPEDLPKIQWLKSLAPANPAQNYYKIYDYSASGSTRDNPSWLQEELDFLYEERRRSSSQYGISGLPDRTPFPAEIESARGLIQDRIQDLYATPEGSNELLRHFWVPVEDVNFEDYQNEFRDGKMGIRKVSELGYVNTEVVTDANGNKTIVRTPVENPPILLNGDIESQDPELVKQQLQEMDVRINRKGEPVVKEKVVFVRLMTMDEIMNEVDKSLTMYKDINRDGLRALVTEAATDPGFFSIIDEDQAVREQLLLDLDNPEYQSEQFMLSDEAEAAKQSQMGVEEDQGVSRPTKTAQETGLSAEERLMLKERQMLSGYTPDQQETTKTPAGDELERQRIQQNLREQRRKIISAAEANPDSPLAKAVGKQMTKPLTEKQAADPAAQKALEAVSEGRARNPSSLQSLFMRRMGMLNLLPDILGVAKGYKNVKQTEEALGRELGPLEALNTMLQTQALSPEELRSIRMNKAMMESVQRIQ